MARPPFERPGVDSSDVDIIDAVQNMSLRDPARPDEVRVPPKAGIAMDEVKMPSKELFDNEKFMAEDLEVMLPEPGNDNEPNFVEVAVNGDYRCHPRDGNTHTFKRYHIGVLAAAKQGRVRQKKITLADGSMGFQDEVVLALTYPFQVVSDPSGRRGVEWLKAALRNPG
jgi:hypothetical protein